MALPSSARLAPLVAGLAGLVWFWFELEPQRTGFEDTDNPATGLRFLAAHPDAWRFAGVALAIAAIAFAATVISVRDRFGRAEPGADGISGRLIAVLGMFAALLLLGQSLTRLAGGPVAYVQGLDQGWGETAYLVTQFVGVQLFGVGGMAMLALWIVSVAWLGARRGVVPRAVAILAVLPAIRLVAILALLEVLPDGLWPLYMLALPGAFAWLIALGAWPSRAVGVGRVAPAASAGARL